MFLPTSIKELKALKWDYLDVILFTGDAYVDHPAFGVAVIARVLESKGYKVAVVPQPNWQDDLRDFKKFGKPRLFFGVTAGNMDSMVNHYTANKRLRSDDAYTAGGRAGARPDYATKVYSNILKKLFPEVPVVIGGVEASMRRFAHYDYWSDKLLPSILIESKADFLIYGMAEKSIALYADCLSNNLDYTTIPQLVYREKSSENIKHEHLILNSFKDCLQDKKKYAENFKVIETESNKMHGKALVQDNLGEIIVANPMFASISTEELDAIHALPFTRLPHPRYDKKAQIPAYDMIKNSINIHRGCFGGCSFCTISAHQGKFVSSRSEESILKELDAIVSLPGFAGHISDLGGPSANMYKMQGKDLLLCEKCTRPSCIFPNVCKNLDISHKNLTTLYSKVAKHSKVKKLSIGSGVRYDIALHKTSDENLNNINQNYLRILIKNYVSGRLKVAPEHSEDRVLKLMRKTPYKQFEILKNLFDRINKEEGRRYQLIPYFISSHPGCEIVDMANLAVKTKEQGFRLEQVQDFTPTPMTLSTVMYYTGINPYSGEKVYSANTVEKKRAQQKYFFWYKDENRQLIKNELEKLGMSLLAKRLINMKNNS